jgi:hypothetical protein
MGRWADGQVGRWADGPMGERYALNVDIDARITAHPLIRPSAHLPILPSVWVGSQKGEIRAISPWPFRHSRGGAIA